MSGASEAVPRQEVAQAFNTAKGLLSHPTRPYLKKKKEKKRNAVKKEPFLCVYGIEVYSKKLRIT